MRLFTAVLLLAASQLMAQDPIDAKGWLQRGVREFQSAHYPGAVEAFERAVDADPISVPARIYLGTAWMQQYVPGSGLAGNRAVAEAAANAFLKALEMDPGNKTAMNYLASLSLNQKKWDDAQAWYQKLADADPRDTRAWYGLGFTAWSRCFQADADARESLGMRPEDRGPLPAGEVKAALKRKCWQVIEDGMNALQRALLFDFQYGGVWVCRGLLSRVRADLRDTERDYRIDIRMGEDWADRALQIGKQKGVMTGGGAR